MELTKDDERSENHKAQMNAFFELLEERFLDVNPYCRCKAIQVYYSKLLEYVLSSFESNLLLTVISLDAKFPKRRQKAADLACRSLEDKSSNVRRNAIKLLTKLIATHPYGTLHGGTLKFSEWLIRLEETESEINSFKSPVGQLIKGSAEPNETVDTVLLDDATIMEASHAGENEGESSIPRAEEQEVPPQVNSEEIARLQLSRRYYAEALRFIETVHSASNTVRQLLSSKNKSETIEAMDFFKTLDVHKIETAKV